MSLTRWIGLTLLALPLLLCSSVAADGRIHSCRNADGSVQFQDRPCERAPEAAVEASRSHARMPAGIHPSWFERPPVADVEARCDPTGCTCGEVRRVVESGFVTAVADALYIDGAWHRLEEETESRKPGDDADDGAVAIAACDVLISQQTLLLHAETVLREMRSRARDAENRGYHRAEVCEAGNAQACAALDGFQLYRRMVADLGTLRRERRDAGTSVDVPPLSPAARSSR